MARDPRYDVLFEPVRIGPVTARNRFYQVPHCNGMGRDHPTSWAVMRGVKAEGGWAVVSTEQCDIHPTTETSREIRLWDERDLPYLARMTELVHRHGSLAAIELVHMGYQASNLSSREVPMAPSARPVPGILPLHARAMDKSDIADYRRWHLRAVRNAKKAGFDIVYVYAGHDLSLAMHFLSPRHNRRSDEYGGSMENRARLLRELIEDTREAAGDTMGVAVRLAVDELLGERGLLAEREGREVIEMLGELPDLWDVNCSDWDNDSITSRFAGEGFQEPYIRFVKQVTTRPVVGVGRYTSPDRMAELVRKGVLDFIGAARPSIADPFLPKKIEEGRIEDIRECIGCNVCVASDNLGAPMRCTQNPTKAEEWRKGWHPERIPPRDTGDRVLVVGAGPAGLEAARALGQRGHEVLLAEARGELGGRVARECRLPGLAAWGRVRDWRVGQMEKLPEVRVYPGSRLDAAEVREIGCSLVALATGSWWRRDGAGRHHESPLAGALEHPGRVLTPDDLLDGAEAPGPVVVFDDDHYYMGGVIAEKLAREGREVVLVTPAAWVSAWTEYTLELERIQRRMREVGVEVLTHHALAAIGDETATIEPVYGGGAFERACASVVLVTASLADDALYRELCADPEALGAAGIRRVVRIGDCLAPGTIAAAVYSGHRFARDLGEEPGDALPYARETVELSADFAMP